MEMVRAYTEAEKQEKREALFQYLREHPDVTGREAISAGHSLALEMFRNRINDAKVAAGVPHDKMRIIYTEKQKEQIREEFLEYLGEHPDVIGREAISAGHRYALKMFGNNINDAKVAAGVPVGHIFAYTEKQKEQIREEFLEYLREHPDVIGREAISAGHRYALEMFGNNINDAKREAGIPINERITTQQAFENLIKTGRGQEIVNWVREIGGDNGVLADILAVTYE